jgi:hypothetical protein
MAAVLVWLFLLWASAGIDATTSGSATMESIVRRINMVISSLGCCHEQLVVMHNAGSSLKAAVRCLSAGQVLIDKMLEARRFAVDWTVVQRESAVMLNMRHF